MKKRNIFLCIALLLSALTGCTKEDYRNCPAGLWIAFEPINPKHDYPAKVRSVSLYFYDPATGNLKENFDFTASELRPTDRAAFIPQIPSMTYRVVAVINCGVYTTTVGTENYSTLVTALNEEVMNTKPLDLFSGEKNITVTVNTTETIPVEVMPLLKHNNNVHLNLIYDEYTVTPGVTIDAWIEGTNADYRYSAVGTATARARYTAWDKAQNSENGLPARFSFTTMHLWHGSDMELHVCETGVTRAEMKHYTLNLTDHLAKIQGEENQYLYDTDYKLAFEDEYELTVKLGKDTIAIAVGVDRWDTTGGETEL